MNILGVGPAEIIMIFIIMLVVAGPKRMIVWSYHLGRYFQQFRAMVDEAWGAVRKELEESQVDLPKELPKLRRFDIVQEANKLVNNEMASKTAEINAELSKTTNALKSSPNKPAESATPTSPAPDKKDTSYDAWLPN
jgi:Sec-independent protein translocase protein TatA